MAQKSLFWFTDGFDGAIGDGSAPYTQQEFSDRNRFTLGEGVITGSGIIDNPLSVSGTSSPLSVSAGRAIVRGFHYESDDIETIAVSTPSVGTTGGRVVLRASYGSATVRIALKLSADGVGAIPALTNIENDTWEVTLVEFTINTSGIITVDTDSRNDRLAFTRLANPDFVTLDRDRRGHFQIADGGVSTAKLADGAVTTVKLADDAVTADKAGEGVPVLTDRQGANSTNWAAQGTNNFTVGKSSMQFGLKVLDIAPGTNSTNDTITLPVGYQRNPVVFPIIVNQESTVGTDPFALVTETVGLDLTAPFADFRITLVTTDRTNVAGVLSVRVAWLAIGEPA